MQPVKKSNTLRNVLITIIVGVILTCCCLAAAVAFTPSSTKPTNSSSSSSTNAAATILAFGTNEPNTEAPLVEAEKPTDTDLPEPTNTIIPPSDTPSPSGASRDAPLPYGSSGTIDSMIITILGVTRPANDIVVQGNSFNSEPEAGNEYVMVELSLSCTKDSNDKCSFSPFSTSLVGSKGVIYDAELFIAGVDGQLETGEFFGGSTQSGKIFFEAGQGETDLILIYEAFFSEMYFALQ